MVLFKMLIALSKKDQVNEGNINTFFYFLKA